MHPVQFRIAATPILVVHVLWDPALAPPNALASLMDAGLICVGEACVQEPIRNPAAAQCGIDCTELGDDYCAITTGHFEWTKPLFIITHVRLFTVLRVIQCSIFISTFQYTTLLRRFKEFSHF